MDYDETGTHILIDTKVNGEDRKILAHAGRNGFHYTFDRLNGQFLKATQYVPTVTWTKGIDPKTGKPVDYDPAKDLQTYADPIAKILTGAKQRRLPGRAGRQQFLVGGLQREDEARSTSPSSRAAPASAATRPAMCAASSTAATSATTGALTSGMVVVDPATGEVKKRKAMPYPNIGGALATAGGIIVTALLDGTVMALDDQTLEELWSINVGTGINAPPMTYAVDGKQYIAIATGLTRNQIGRLATTPELRKPRPNATMIFVFAL